MEIGFDNPYAETKRLLVVREGYRKNDNSPLENCKRNGIDI